MAATYKRAVKIAYKDAIELADLAIDGTDLAKLGIAGPQVGCHITQASRSGY